MTEYNEKLKQVHQQACKMQIPPYGLSRRRRPQFRMPTERGRWLRCLFGRTRISYPNSSWNGCLCRK